MVYDLGKYKEVTLLKDAEVSRWFRGGGGLGGGCR